MVAELIKKLKNKFNGKRQVWVFQGLPGVGKTTAILPVVRGFGKKVISYDKIRETLYGDAAIQGNIAEILAEAKRQFDELILHNNIIIIDITCSKREYFDFWVSHAAQWGITRVEIVRVANYNNAALAKQRNAERAARGGRYVSESIIDQMSAELASFDYSGIVVTDWTE